MDPVYRIPTDLIREEEAEFLPLAGELNWGIARFKVDRLRNIADGTGIVVGVVDTGIDDKHVELSGQVKAAKDFTGSPSGPMDRNGHGTHVSGTIASRNPNIGFAPGAKIVHAKGLSDGGSGGGKGIAAAMMWCFEQGAEIISMSLGSSGRDDAIDQAGAALTAQGVWIACAAGNAGGGTPAIDFPGRLPWAISVASLDETLNVSSFSSAGEGIETSAPGSNIWSLRPGGGYAKMSGTSMATPACAGMLALYLSCLKKFGKAKPSPEELQAILQSDSMDVGVAGVDRRAGPGAIWPLLLANNVIDAPPPIAA